MGSLGDGEIYSDPPAIQLQTVTVLFCLGPTSEYRGKYRTITLDFQDRGNPRAVE